MNTPAAWQSISILLLVLLLTGLPLQPALAPQAITWTVNSLNDVDDGVCDADHCSLREAIQAANAASTDDQILFALSGTITLGSMLPGIEPIGGTITIDGSGFSVHISGAGVHSILFVKSGARLILVELTLQDGNGPVAGGAVYHSGTLTVKHCTFSHNKARDMGGAIYAHGSLTVEDSNFIGNSVDVNNGGAIYAAIGSANVIRSRFQENTSTYSGGAIHVDGAGASLHVKESVFVLNTAFGGPGGAISNDWNLTIENSTFALNLAEDSGGAVYSARGGKYTITGSAFNFNSSRFGSGGALWADNSYQVSSVEESTFHQNEAAQDGGAFYISDGEAIFRLTRFSHNEAKRDGGGGYNRGGSVSISFATFEGNKAGQNGGGYFSQSRGSISRSAFSGNQAVDSGGGVYYPEGTVSGNISNSTFYNNSADQGGALALLRGFQVQNCTIVGNSAPEGRAAGIFANISAYISNTIVANSTSGDNCVDGSTQFNNNGNNIDSGTTCHFGQFRGSQSNTDPMLGPLQSNGGPSLTMMPAPDSPAIDGVTFVDLVPCSGVDQRGYPRPFGEGCDIGAVEAYFLTQLPLVMKQSPFHTEK